MRSVFDWSVWNKDTFPPRLEVIQWSLEHLLKPLHFCNSKFPRAKQHFKIKVYSQEKDTGHDWLPDICQHATTQGTVNDLHTHTDTQTQTCTCAHRHIINLCIYLFIYMCVCVLFFHYCDTSLSVSPSPASGGTRYLNNHLYTYLLKLDLLIFFTLLW